MKYFMPIAALTMILGVSTVHADNLKVGAEAPDFTAPASDGTTFHLKDALSHAPIVLYFYPKDNTPGCTKEACSLRDDFASVRKLNATVYGISYDTIESHKKFIAEHNLPFVLLSDHDKKIAKLYDADGLLFAKRMTYIVDKTGHIAWVDPNVSPSTHSAEVQAALAKING